MAQVAERFPVGTDVDAVVTRLMPFGAFARVAEGLEGLVHVSELAESRIAQPRTSSQRGMPCGSVSSPSMTSNAVCRCPCVRRDHPDRMRSRERASGVSSEEDAGRLVVV